MIHWIPFVFVRVTFLFIAGVVLGIYHPELIPQQIAICILVVLIVVYSLSWFVFKRKSSTAFGLIGLGAIFLAGYVQLLLQTESRQPTHLLNSHFNAEYYHVTINSFTQSKEKSWKVEGVINKVFAEEKWIETATRVVLYFPKEDFETPFQYGDVLLIKGSPKVVTEPANPYEFDYRRYLSFRNIHHQDFLRKNEVQWISNEPPSVILQYSILTRIYFESLLEEHVSGEREKAIAVALVLGITDGLDDELLGAYAATGAMHVLAVSGLHVSIIYLILIWLMKPVTRGKSGPWIVALVSIIILWIYAFVTGLSPSVLRAVVMFSFMAIAKPLNQNSNIYNTLAASAFLILLFEPMLVMSVGFQLSYLAVIGIVYYQRSLYRLWSPESKLIDEAWKITTVSIAAQISTFALGLLYFHQFPNYFLLSNLLVIPGSFAVLILGLLVLAFSFIPYVIDVLGFLLTWSIKILNFIVFAVEALPFSLIEDIYLDTFQCWILILIIVSITLLIQLRKFYYLSLLSGLVIVFSASQWIHLRESVSQKRLVVYKADKHFAMDLLDNGIAYFSADTSLLKQPLKIQFHLRPMRLNSGIHFVHSADSSLPVQQLTGGRFLQWNETTILHATSEIKHIPLKAPVDFLVISNNAIGDLTFLSEMKPQIILDGTNSYFYSKRLNEQAKRLDLRLHSVLESGAFNFCLTCH